MAVLGVYFAILLSNTPLPHMELYTCTVIGNSGGVLGLNSLVAISPLNNQVSFDRRPKRFFKIYPIKKEIYFFSSLQTCEQTKRAMIELGLGLALLAVLGSTIELFKLVKLVVDRINCFQYASSFLHELKTFGYDLSDGQLHLAVRLVEGYIINDNRGGGGGRYSGKDEDVKVGQLVNY